MVKHYLKLIRIHHWMKNGLIFLPLLFSGNALNPQLLTRTVFGFLTFCFIASLVYVVNDIQDIEEDRNHPTKCRRPLASGKISLNFAKKFILPLLAVLAAACCVYVCQANFAAWTVLLMYVVFNLGYSHGLKDIPILDIVILVSGFVLRVGFGSAITGIEISNWLYLTVFASCTYVALGKRRNELRIARLTPQDIDSPITRNVLSFYNFAFLDKNMYVCLTLSLTFYALWCVDAKTLEKTGSEYLVWTVPLLIIMGMKYSLDVEREGDGDPVEVILDDKILLFLGIAFAVILSVMIYGNF
jgi:4-hydroxybenzoate polyprenyltransferase